LGRFHERELEAEVDKVAAEVSDAGQTRLQGLQQQLRRAGLRGTTWDDDDGFGGPEQRPEAETL
jgi:hypothetical protein